MTKGRYTRSGIVIESLQGIVVHYIGNPGTNAAANISYFESIRENGPKFASYHEIIDLDGTRYDLIPHTEVAWHAGPTPDTFEETTELLGGRPNWRTIGISYCHPDATGKPNGSTEHALIRRVALLASRYDIPGDRILRHYDCTGKRCPMWYVDNFGSWLTFKRKVESMRNAHKEGLVE